MSSATPGIDAGCPPRVAIVDADRRVQQSIADVLRVAGVEVVGTAGDVRSALELVAAQAPTVLMLDPHLPDPDAGEALVASIALGWPALRVVIMGWPDSTAARPVPGQFISKSASPEEFVAATVDACRG